MILSRYLYNNNLWLHLAFGLHRFTQSNRCHLNSETVSVLGHHKQSSCLFFVHFGRDLSAPFFVFACQGHTMMDGGPPSVDSVLSVGTLLILLRLRVTSYIGLCLPVPEIHARGYSANWIYLSRSTFLTNVQQSYLRIILESFASKHCIFFSLTADQPFESYFLSRFLLYHYHHGYCIPCSFIRLDGCAIPAYVAG